ncbi:MAG TPA: tRNA pseudouridine(38-40) synthase TruA [Gemmatimonadales bacterium]|jgi:tRNA pseudouridine38-40 synthase|nr:tRNA pseudouridine(38-40) synthase TruA [Gemmatimonadales bacterium]
MARTFLVTLHYDGGQFAGWQRQASGRTVQAEIEQVLERISERPVRAHAAGRTDAGVHALGMAVSCSLPDRWEAGTLHRALNALLPTDCWVAGVQEMRAGFHARKCATGRRYRYLIGTDAGSRSPFRRRYEWALGEPLDRAALDAAAGPLSGEHDFSAFSVRSSWRAHKRCRIVDARWLERPDGHGLSFEIAADRFLHHMVRMLVGTLAEIGLRRRAPSDMTRLLALDPGLRTSPPAPSEGLFFVAAEYPAEWSLL